MCIFVVLVHLHQQFFQAFEKNAGNGFLLLGILAGIQVYRFSFLIFFLITIFLRHLGLEKCIGAYEADSGEKGL